MFRIFGNTVLAASLQHSARSFSATAGDITAEKNRIRSEIKKSLSNLSRESVEDQSLMVAAHLVTLKCLEKAKSGVVISSYLPMEGGQEVDTFPILERLHKEKQASICVPRWKMGSRDMHMSMAPSFVDLRSLPLDRWQIPIPDPGWRMVDESEVEIILVPCVALGRDGRRLGHGKGFYDSYVTRVSSARAKKGLAPPVLIGLALREQILPEGDIPVDERDRPISYIVCPEGVVFES